jgi:molecular chaperone GrpE (heat shock protein)
VLWTTWKGLLNHQKRQTKTASCSKGVDLTLKEILKIFEKFNVKPIEGAGKGIRPGCSSGDASGSL